MNQMVLKVLRGGVMMFALMFASSAAFAQSSVQTHEDGQQRPQQPTEARSCPEPPDPPQPPKPPRNRVIHVTPPSGPINHEN